MWFIGCAWAAGFGEATDDGGRGAPFDPGLVDLPTDPPGGEPGAAPVVGGHPARDGRWDDAVGLVFLSSYVGCTGTLIGPKTVLTAGHCVLGYPVTHVIVGSTDWFDASKGEILEVARAIEYPNSQQTYDVALLVLREASTYTPRALAAECITEEYLTDGAPVQTVGWGVTDEDGTDYNHELNEAATTILDKNCSEDQIGDVRTGCNDDVRPGGELVAGKFGQISVCYGDSGGPLYLKTDAGDFVTGVASRLIFGPDFYTAPCSNGGVWVRTDAILDWIIDEVGKNKITLPVCNDAPTVDVAGIVTAKNRADSTTFTVIDPDGDPTAAKLAIGVAPVHGEATIDGLTVTYTPAAGFVGEDPFIVAVTDGGNPDWEHSGDPVSINVQVPVTVRKAFLGIGCETAPGAGWLALGLLAFAGRRRR